MAAAGAEALHGELWRRQRRDRGETGTEERDRDAERQRDRETETQRHRDTETQRQTDGDTVIEPETDREADGEEWLRRRQRRREGWPREA